MWVAVVFKVAIGIALEAIPSDKDGLLPALAYTSHWFVSVLLFT